MQKERHHQLIEWKMMYRCRLLAYWSIHMHALGSYSRGNKINTFVCQAKLREVICDIIEFTAVKYNIALAEFIDEGGMEELFRSTMCAVPNGKQSKSTTRSGWDGSIVLLIEGQTVELRYGIRSRNCTNHHKLTFTFTSRRWLCCQYLTRRILNMNQLKSMVSDYDLERRYKTFSFRIKK